MNIQMICISGNSISEYYSKICIEEWNRLGYNINKFEATTPSTRGNKLKFQDTKFSGNPFTETEMAVWESHYRLWEYAVEVGPLYIIEHDTYPFKPLKNFSNMDFAIFSIFPRGRNRWLKYHEFVSPGSGYYLTKNTAKRLIELTHKRNIRENVDGHIHSNFRDFLAQTDEQFQKYHLPNVSCFQIINDRIGTTISHNE